MKFKKLVILLFTAFMLAGCGGGAASSENPSSTTPSSSKADSGLPSSIPTYDEESIQLHYYRKDGNYSKWALWLWKYPDGEGKEYQFNGLDDYGAVASYPLSTWSGVKTGGLGFIVKTKGSWSSKDPDGDRIVDFNKFVADSKNVHHVYLQSGDKNMYPTKDLEEMDTIKSAKFENFKRIIVETNKNITAYKVFEGSTQLASVTLDTPNKGFRYSFEGDKKASFDKDYKVQVTFEKTKATLESPISVSSLFKTKAFDEAYNYDGELGAIYTKDATTFKVWSPVSKKIVLRIFNNGTPKSVDSSKGDDTIYKEITLTKGDKGVFSAVVEEDLEGKYYTYLVNNGTYNRKEIVDPYAYSTGVNGMRGMIVDFSKTNPSGFDTMKIHNIDRKHLTVYETHVADITSSTTWTNDANTRKYEKTFKGAALTGTTYTNGGVTVKTGFDHIKELGVNAVQFIPIFDQANDETKMTFNWGYNPANYNALEGGYSTDPYNGYTRISEFKEMVQAYNQAGINVIMDVVYNHMNGASGSPFDVLMPGYYFRYNTDGTLSNGSGCGNETASEMYMMRKFIIDSTYFWAKEYKLGGFRFDLMGLHDLDTMAALSKKLKELNPSITVYGEPWSGGTSTLADSVSAKQVNMAKYNGYGAFNDKMRDALIKGGLNAASAKGWVTNNSSAPDSSDLAAIKSGVKGAVKLDGGEVSDPNKVVNYVTCHDNYTLYDRIKAVGIKDEEVIKKMAMLSNSVVFTSNGTTFMLAGEEFLRTKGGNNNSYNASYKVNELDYSLKIKNLDMFTNYQKLIKFKQETEWLALPAGSNNAVVADTSKGNVISYSYEDSTSGKTYIVIHCNGYNPSSLPKVDLSGYTLILDTINSSKPLTSQTQLEAYETIIAVK